MTEGGIAAGLNRAIKQRAEAACVSASASFCKKKQKPSFTS
jgi:hypothetical protein